MTTQCPECKTALKLSAKRCACGWKAASPSGSILDSERDPDDKWRCSSVMLGQRCNEVGSFKRGDRWFCYVHAGRKMSATTAETLEIGRRGLEQARAAISKGIVIPQGPRRIGEIMPPAHDLEAIRERAGMQQESRRPPEDEPPDIPWSE